MTKSLQSYGELLFLGLSHFHSLEKIQIAFTDKDVPPVNEEPLDVLSVLLLSPLDSPLLIENGIL
jgi:hypothetical protein